MNFHFHLPGKLRVPVVDMLFLVAAAQFLDYLAQHHQRFVNTAPFFQPEQRDLKHVVREVYNFENIYLERRRREEQTEKYGEGD